MDHKKLDVVDDDIASHNSFASIGLSRLNAFFAKLLNSFTKYVDSLRRCVTG